MAARLYVPKALERIAAEGLDPGAFQPYKRRRVLCGSGWHWEGHSSHSTCPTCSSDFTTSDFIEKQGLERRRERAMEDARRMLRALARAGKIALS